jgi:hypothetical protein
MLYITISIVDPSSSTDINIFHYKVADFELKKLIGICLEISSDGILKSIEKTEIPSQLFAYIRELHRYVPSKTSSEEKNILTSSSSISKIKGGKTFTSIIKQVLLFVRYELDVEINSMVDDMNYVMGIECLIQKKLFSDNALSQNIMMVPGMSNRTKVLRLLLGKKDLDLKNHEFTSNF